MRFADGPKATSFSLVPIPHNALVKRNAGGAGALGADLGDLGPVAGRHVDDLERGERRKNVGAHLNVRPRGIGAVDAGEQGLAVLAHEVAGYEFGGVGP